MFETKTNSYSNLALLAEKQREQMEICYQNQLYVQEL